MYVQMGVIDFIKNIVNPKPKLGEAEFKQAYQKKKLELAPKLGEAKAQSEYESQLNQMKNQQTVQFEKPKFDFKKTIVNIAKDIEKAGDNQRKSLQFQYNDAPKPTFGFETPAKPAKYANGKVKQEQFFSEKI